MNKALIPSWSVLIKVHFTDEEEAIDFLLKQGPIELIKHIYPDVYSDANFIYLNNNRYTAKELAPILATELVNMYLIASTHYIIRNRKDPGKCTSGVLRLQTSATQFSEPKYTKNLPHILSRSFRRVTIHPNLFD